MVLTWRLLKYYNNRCSQTCMQSFILREFNGRCFVYCRFQKITTLSLYSLQETRSHGLMDRLSMTTTFNDSSKIGNDDPRAQTNFWICLLLSWFTQFIYARHLSDCYSEQRVHLFAAATGVGCIWSCDVCASVQKKGALLNRSRADAPKLPLPVSGDLGAGD